MSQLELIDDEDRREPEAILAEATECEGCPLARVCLISGGNDSTVTAHRCRDHYDELAFIDTGTALPGVRDFVIEFAKDLGKPLRVLESGPAYAELVLGNRLWWEFARRERGAGESLSDFVLRTTPLRKQGDGLGNAPHGFPGPAGGHRAAYARLKERQIEELMRRLWAEHGGRGRVQLLSGARRHESRRRSMNQGTDGFRRRKSQVWVNPLNDWRNDEMAAYRREHGIPTSDVAALLHRSGECNCGAYMSTGELADVVALFPDWHREFIVPLQDAARDLGIPRYVWGERTDTGRVGARGWPFQDGISPDQLALSFGDDRDAGGELCTSCGGLEPVATDPLEVLA